jgi:hypothetical protein
MTTQTPQSLVGQHVYIIGEHPWAGERGEIIGWDAGMLLFKVRIECDDAMNGHECFADIEHLRRDRRHYE